MSSERMRMILYIVGHAAEATMVGKGHEGVKLEPGMAHRDYY